jgi:serine O-acetyltransferase
MGRRRSRARLALARLWAYPLWCGIRYSNVHGVVADDVAWWITCIDDAELRGFDSYTQFAYLSGALAEFRTLAHFRLRQGPAALRLVLRIAYRPSPTLILEADRIGPALFIQHGLGTIVTATSIGSRCWINQQVTIGHDAVGRPTLGDDVRVGAAAVVLGPITLHDGAKVGANATVIHDVGPGETVVAPLARTLGPRRADGVDGPVQEPR